jgi:hypothetical protein
MPCLVGQGSWLASQQSLHSQREFGHRNQREQTMARRFGYLFGAILLSAVVWLNLPAQAESNRGEALYFADMSRCEPRAALSHDVHKNCWQIISYETMGSPRRGKMLGAASYVEAPNVTLPLGVTGWYAIYVGFWNPHFAYDGGTVVKIKLSDDPCFTRIQEPEPKIDYDATYIREALFKAADLTGRTLQFGKVNGAFAQKAYIAYIKLVPLSKQQVADLLADRARKNTRILQGSVDGCSFFGANEYRTKEQILELVEPFRYSDVGKVIWSVNVDGVRLNYPSKIGVFYPEHQTIPIDSAPNSYIAWEKTLHESLKSLADKGVIPEAVVSEHLHSMGIKFDIMFRMTIAGGVPPWRNEEKGYVRTHPQFRQLQPDGTPIEKASYAFPEVRNLVVSIIREAVERFDADGVSLGFVRGPEFTGYEQPVLDDFHKEYRDDARKVRFDDLRMRSIRFRYLNAFVRDVREALGQIGKKRGKRLELSAWIRGMREEPNYDINRGMDVEHWMRQGWLDSVLAMGGSPNPAIVAAAKANKCRFIAVVEGFDPFAPSVGKQLASRWIAEYGLGADGVALWDINGCTDVPTAWPILRRAGHRKELEAAASQPAMVLPTVRLKTLGGFDVGQGLREAVYSGG